MKCPQCGQLLPYDSEFCQYCGIKLAGLSVPAGNATPSNAPELAGKTCPFCKAPFMEGEAVVFCSHCEMPHHLDCWKENGGCTTFGCTGNIGKIIGAEQKNAQSAPVATRKPAEAPKTIPYPQTKPTSDNKQQVNRPAPAAAPVRPEPQTQYSVLAENAEKVLQGKLPILLEKTVLLKEGDGKLSVVCSFRSLADKTIQAMQIDVKCADIWRETVKPVEGHQYLDLSIRRDELFGENERIVIPDPNTRVVDVVVRKIMFSDGTLLQRDGENIRVSDPMPLVKTLGEELFEEYKCQTFQNANYAPTRIGDFWRCTCGALNREEEGDCHLCGDSLASLMSHLDKEMLQRSVDEKNRIKREKEERERKAREEALRLKKEKAERERKEREERLRIQREKEAAEAAERKRIAEEKARAEAEAARIRTEQRKKRNKKIAIIFTAAAVLALIVYLVGWQLIPSVKYNKAEQAIAAGDLELAYSQFSSIPRYKDSKVRAQETRYEQAEAALKNKDFDTAYEFFSEIAEYNDSETKAKEALYQKAEALKNENKFSEAREIYQQLKNYKKSPAFADECLRAQKYYDAVSLLESGKYEEAATGFAGVSYADSKELAQKAYYLYAKELIEKGKLHEAYTVLTEKVNNKGKPPFEDSIELANQVEYQYASDCFDAGKFEDAYSSFGNIKEYENSADLYLDAGYQYALQLFEKKSYDKAATVFASLGKFKDSEKQANESKYQYALSLQGKGEYSKAEKLFTELGNYRDSATQIKETKYQHALALLKKKEYQNAEKLFTELGNYSDSAKQAKEAKYQRALSFVKDKKYTQAVPIFKELGNYSDSLEQWKFAMWSYVLAHKNNDDKTTYEYLTALKRYNYRLSKTYYDDLYTWHATISVYTSSTSSSRASSISRYQKYVRVEWKVTGGTPGERIKVREYDTWPGHYCDETTSNVYDGYSYSGYWDDFSADSAGTLTIKLYNKNTGALIATATVKIT